MGKRKVNARGPTPRQLFFSLLLPVFAPIARARELLEAQNVSGVNAAEPYVVVD